MPRHGLQRAHARLDKAGAVAQTAGPALAGALIRVLGAPLAVLVDALTYLFSAVMVASLKGVAEPAAAPPAQVGARGLAREVREGARWAYGGSGLRRLAVSTHVWFAGQAVLLVVVVPYGYLQLDLTSLQLGLVFAVAGLGALLGASMSTAVGRRLGTGGAIICAYSVSALGVLVMLGAASAPTGWAGAAVLAAGQLCHGWAMGTSNSHEMTFRQARTPDGLQARTNTTLRSLNRAVIVVVSPVAGLLADQVGFRQVLAAAAAIFGAVGPDADSLVVPACARDLRRRWRAADPVVDNGFRRSVAVGGGGWRVSARTSPPRHPPRQPETGQPRPHRSSETAL